MSLIPFDDRDGFIWFNGSLIPWREAKIHVLSHALHYGSSVFEGERVFRCKGGDDECFTVILDGMQVVHRRDVAGRISFITPEIRPADDFDIEPVPGIAFDARQHALIIT